MKKTDKRKFKIELPEHVFRTLDKYGYDYIKNIAQMLSDDAYYIELEEEQVEIRRKKGED